MQPPLRMMTQDDNVMARSSSRRRSRCASCGPFNTRAFFMYFSTTSARATCMCVPPFPTTCAESSFEPGTPHQRKRLPNTVTQLTSTLLLSANSCHAVIDTWTRSERGPHASHAAKICPQVAFHNWLRLFYFHFARLAPRYVCLFVSCSSFFVLCFRCGCCSYHPAKQLSANSHITAFGQWCGCLHVFVYPKVFCLVRATHPFSSGFSS